MELLLSDTEREVARSARRFAEEAVLPRAAAIDETDEFPRDLWREMAGLGLFGICLPEAAGGTGLDAMCFALAEEELARCSGSVGNILAIPVEMVRLLHGH